MAYKVQAEIRERFKRFIRYSVRLGPMVVIIAAIAWFFLLRSPGGQTPTSGSGGTVGTPPETTVSTETPNPQPEPKVADNSTLAGTSKEPSKAESGKLPETGSAETLVIFIAASLAGTLFWEWRLRRAKLAND